MKTYFAHTNESIRHELMRNDSMSHSSQGYFGQDQNSMYSGRPDEACKTLMQDLQRGMSELMHLKPQSENYDPNIA